MNIKNKNQILRNIFYNLNYKNLELKNYILDNGKKILPQRKTKLKRIFQKKISKYIKISRYLSLLPYCDRHKKNIN